MTRPAIEPTGLPVEAVVPDVDASLGAVGTTVLVAPPGAGKTTVVPIRLLGSPWLAGQRIVVLEPRRLAARAAAARMADLLGEPVGRTVGFRTRDERVGGRDVRIEVITEGILVRRLQADPSLEGTGLVVLDEVRERNLVTDLSLAMVADARSGLRPDLRVLAMSATVDAERFARVLAVDGQPAPIVRSDGRTFPVEVHHTPPAARDRPDAHLARVVATALAHHPDGDVLVFLPGAADIRRVADRLTTPGALPASVDVRPLFGALGPADQDAALAPSPAGRRRVVLATDIAESSLTVAGVQIVVDAGLVRVPRFDPGSGMTRLQTEPASMASADQRAGRAGRLGPGVAYRAWDPTDAGRRSRFPVAEIAVADLAGFVLELAVWGAAPDQVPLVESPPPGALAQARALLVELGAIDHRGRPTDRGRAMAALPVHPRLAAMVHAGIDDGDGWTAAVLAALLEERDVVRGRADERPVDLTARVQAVAGDGDGELDVDRGAARTVRRRAEQLARRAGIERGPLAPDAVGPLVAVAYPDRIAQASGAGYRLRGGGGGHLPGTDPLASSPFLAVAQVEPGPRGPRIALAAALTEAEVRRAVADDVEEHATLRWDAERDDLRARTEVRSGALVLDATDGPAAPGPETTAALVDHVRATDGAVLRWTPAARALQGRLAFLHGQDPDRWPDVADASLLATLDDWLAPMLPGAVGRRDLERIDLVQALGARLDHRARTDLDRLAPTSFTAADGRTIGIAYDDGPPRSSARTQDLYGITVHPTVANDVPVVIELLSPARRPVQVTADLPGFWAGSWSEVRKELAGRYPKHDWPADPAASLPSRPSRSPRRR